ncbi:MAG: LTA synthase family protein [Actinomycetaceae bacterium]|nr:LTA synthase family protein [Actinomycetaceae bacterium]
MLRELAVHLAALQVSLMLVVAVGWALAQKSTRSLLYGALQGVFANAAALLAVGVLRPEALPVSAPLSTGFIVKYSALVMLCAVVGALVVSWGAGGGYREAKPRRRPAWRLVMATVLYVLAGFVGGLAFFLSRWVASTFDNVQGDQLLFFLLGGNPGTTPDQNVDLIVHVGLPILAGVVTVGLVPILTAGIRAPKAAASAETAASTQTAATSSSKKSRAIATPQRRTFRRISNAAVSLLLVGALGSTFAFLPISGLLKSYFVRSSLIGDNYVAPTDEVLHFPDKPKNLIHIYLESMENSYYSKDEGGYLEQSLMPDLAQLTDENITFSNTDHYGGPLQTYGATHSVAGMLNFHSGVPMLPAYTGASGGRITYPALDTIGDILHRQGYETSFMLGSSRHWHQLGDYYEIHGNFKVMDLWYARNNGLVPEDYAVWWGIEDDKLYEYAKDEMTRLGQGDKPFYFILENADTHNNGGYVSPLMTEFPSDKQYGNVIHYSQAEVVKLVRWIQAQPWYEDTVIVLTGDHQSMDNEFFIGWDPDYERTVVNVFINGALPDPGPSRTHNRSFAPFDFFPTIMATLGVEIDGDRLGMGTNLYSDKPTLMEQLGFDYVDGELRKRSPFYDSHLNNDLNRNR